MEYTHSVVRALLVTGRNSTMLNNLAVLQAVVSVHRPVHSRIMLTCYLTCQTDCCTPGGNTKMAFSLVCTYCSRNMPEWVPYQNMATYTGDCTTTCMAMSVIHLCSMKSSLPSLYPLHHSCINYSRPSLTFSILQATEN